MIGWTYFILTTVLLLWALAALVRDRRPSAVLPLGAGALLLLWAVTGGILALRFVKGLGAVTNMSDRFPWGVWVGLLQSGVALSAGGFVLAAAVHVFHIRRYEPILRPVVLTAFLGYLFVASVLFIEVGRPYRLWHPLAMWQHHSIMFEVAWCVTLYLTVLAVEVSPAFFERLGLSRAAHWVHRAAIPLVIAGVLLSTLHQSSMGSMFLIMPQKIHPLWYSPLLPVFFLLSSMSAGLCVIVVESFYVSKIFRRSLETTLLTDLARASSFLLGVYGLVRIADITARGAWDSLAGHPVLSALFALEFVGGVLLPAGLLILPWIHAKRRRLFFACLPVLVGAILNRLNVSWLSMTPYTGPGYFPTWMELAVVLTLASLGMAAFAAAVRFLPIFPSDETPAEA